MYEDQEKKGNSFVDGIQNSDAKSSVAKDKFIELIVKVLVDCLELNYVKLSCKMDTQARISLDYRRIQRFVARFRIGQAILAKWILQKISPDEDSRVFLIRAVTKVEFGIMLQKYGDTIIFDIALKATVLIWNQQI